MPLIEFQNVAHHYATGAEPRAVLTGIDVRADERRIGVIGANGSGKSTFARMINGLVLPTSGTVRVDGQDTRRHARQIRREVGFVFTNPDSQIVMPTVREDVAFGLRRLKLPLPEMRARVDEALARFDLTDLADHPAHLLSGGQKQLLALASVMVMRPRLVVLDEPTTLLDLRNEKRIRSEIDRLDEQVVLVTHHLHLLDSFERVLVFEGGGLVCDADPDTARATYLELVT
ncbi:energy-coupling factor ABC transporter ATP-binding protein [Oryzobacter terrae]|uniref:energy-coupling factor ABC transporter ATP-binding protein n=1 Tax=Oryzobacter terrae TaxID=1620385 RepID=UPI00366BF7E7